MQAGLAGALDQRLHQCRTEALAALVATHVYRMFNGMAEALDGAPGAVARVAEHLAGIVHRHQHRKAGGVALGQPGTAVGQVHQGFVPDRRGVLHGVVVDGEDAGKVGFCRITNVHVSGLQDVVQGRSERSSGRARVRCSGDHASGGTLPVPPC
ncbi:hypothetical protein D9M68_858730 [compost metagenome]